MDPMIRSIDTKTYLVIDNKLKQMDKITVCTENLRDEIKELCRKELRAHDISSDCIETSGDLDEASSDCIETSGDLDEAIERCYYLDRTLVSKRTLNILDHHGVKVTQLREMKLRPGSSKKNSSDMLIQLKKNELHTKISSGIAKPTRLPHLR